MTVLWWCALAVAASAAATPAATPPSYHRYVIVGGGPGGLQLAHYLESAGRDYIVLEHASAPASFFARYPRFRRLISINKREVGRADSLDFAMRHDWNSLLSDASHAAAGALPSSTDARLDVASIAPELRFTSWSSEYYPRADALQQYIAAWAGAGRARNASEAAAAPRGLGRGGPLRVRYDTRVVRIARGSGGARWAVSAADGTRWDCHYLVYAGGLAQPVPLPSANGTRAVAEGLVLTYSTAPADADWYTGKRVLVLGHGNAAFEFSDALLRRAALVHVSGRPHSRVSLALETHYPGNVRALHATLLESYNLKSLDGITSAPLERLEFAAVDSSSSGGGRRVAVRVANGTGCTRDAWGRSTGRCSLRRPYDAVIACLGWRFDASAFDADVRPALAPNGKHPAISPRFESANVPGVFFAGALAHANDFKKASGGFIHGFRYTARALHRFLEEEERNSAAGADYSRAAGEQTGGVAPEGAAPHAAAASEAAVAPDGAAALGEGGAAPLRTPARRPPPLPHAAWPSTRTASLRSLAALLLRRANDAAGLYQMFGALCDVFVLDALPAAAVAGYDARALGVRAAMVDLHGFFDEAADAAARGHGGGDDTGLAADVAAMQRRSPPPASQPDLPAASARRRAERMLDAALAGALREEVPVGAARERASAWAAAAAATPPAAAEWLTLSLEFGASPPPGHKDPFSPTRADVDLSRPEASAFIHPVLRYYSAAVPGCGGRGGGSGDDGTSGSGAGARPHECEPLAVLHIVEDFLAEWHDHTPHVLPLARFLAAVAVFRVGAAAGGREEGRPRQSRPQWPAVRPRPPFLDGIIARLAAGCDAATLHVAGGAVGVGGAADGWWHHLSLAAEATLARAGALAVHAADDGSGDGAAALRALTARAPGLAVLSFDARADRCGAVAHSLGLSPGAARVFAQGAEGSARGTVTDIDDEAPLSAATAAAHFGRIHGAAAGAGGAAAHAGQGRAAGRGDGAARGKR